MFEFLRDIPTNQMGMGVHHSLNLLTHQQRIVRPEGEYDVQGSVFPREAQDLASKILSEIQRAERQPASALADERVEHYVKKLGRIVQGSVAERHQYDYKRGEKLLEHFRQTSTDQGITEVVKNIDLPSKWSKLGLGIFRLITRVVDSFGWPGTVIIFMMFFIVAFATPEQKQQLIDTYILGKGFQAGWHVLIFFALAVLVFLAQYAQSQRRTKAVYLELERIALEKTMLQETLLRRLDNIVA